MAFGKIQGRDLDPTMDLAKETTLAEVKSTVESTGATMTSVAKESTVNAVKSVVDEINTNTATVAKESTLTEVKSMVEEIRGDGAQESNVADGDIVMALASDDAGANEWAFKQSGIGKLINDMYSLNSEELIACSTVDDIVASPEAIAAIKNNRHALEFSKKNFKLSYATGVASDESVLAAGMGYLKYNVGDIVTLKYGDADKQFVVAHKNYITQNKIVLVSVDILGTSQWSSSKNDYTSSTLRTYLNSTVLNSFSPEIQAAMVSTEIPCHNYTTPTTCKDKVWALSWTEAGFSGNYYGLVEGHALDLFSGKKNLAKNSTWWLRTPHTKSTAVVWGIEANYNRAEDQIGVTNNYGVVCAFEI